MNDIAIPSYRRLTTVRSLRVTKCMFIYVDILCHNDRARSIYLTIDNIN